MSLLNKRIDVLEKQVERNKYVLGTLITWVCGFSIGEDSANQLLRWLNGKEEIQITGRKTGKKGNG